MSLRPAQSAYRAAVSLSTFVLFAVLISTAQITTYHVDNNRTGWN